MSAKYVIEGHNGKAYIVFEYGGAGAIYVYDGYVRGNVMILYPHHSLVKGLRREKMQVALSEIARRT